MAVVSVDKEPSGFCVVWRHRKRHAKLGDRIGPAGQAGICVSHDAPRPRRLFAHRVLCHEHLELTNRLVIAFQVEQRDAEVVSRANIGAGAGAKERQRIFVAAQARQFAANCGMSDIVGQRSRSCCARVSND